MTIEWKGKQFSQILKQYCFYLVIFLFSSGELLSIDVLFKVNMSHRVNQGLFNPNNDFVDIAGTFNGWGSPSQVLTDEDSDLIYETLISGFTLGQNIEFKFRINGSWSGTEEFPGGGPNRQLVVQTNNNIFEVWYNDEAPSGANPIASFTTSSSKVLEGALVSYRNQTVGSYDRVEWYFEGGHPKTSTDTHPIVRYNSVGNYDVELKVFKGNYSDSKSTSNFLEVIPRDKSELEWWNTTVFYEIFVRSFYDSDGDGIGDFKGMEEKLDYLNDGNPSTTSDLGITGIWLMPMQQSPSYHGYDVKDYRAVEEDYGTMEEFQSFLSAAHDRGIKVIIDYVMNHSSRDHPWFVESRSGVNSPKRNWYVWEDNNPGNTGPWGQRVWHSFGGDFYYGLFWDGMPDLNYESQELQNEMFDIADFWLSDVGVDGFRLDAVRYLYEVNGALEDTPETILFWKDYHQKIKAIKGDAFSVGESWTQTNKVVKYVEDNGLDLCFEFDLSSAILGAVNQGNSNNLYAKIQEVVDVYPHFQFANFLTNHDMDRSFETLGNNQNKSKIAASILMTLPGVPFMYYGEEIGMKGRKPDEFIRRPMQWNAGTHAGFSTSNPWISLNANYRDYNVSDMSIEPESLLSHYRKLIEIREKHPALSIGDFNPVFSDKNVIISYERSYNNVRYLVLQNLTSTASNNINLDFSYSTIPDFSYNVEDLLNNKKITIDITARKGQLAQLAAYETLILRMDNVSSTESEAIESNVTLYPNPTSSTLFLQSVNDNISKVIVSNAEGKICQIYDGNSIKRGFDVSDLSNGVYFIKIFFASDMSIVKRFVVLK